MGIKSKNPKKNWEPGVDMPEWSGKSWKELDDIWPATVRVQSEAWKIISVSYPAFIVTQEFMKTLVGDKIQFREFLVLCWIHRCEEVKAGIATESWAPMKGMNISGAIWYNRKASLTRLGLIENAPVGRIRLYRVTGNGKMVIRYYVDQLEQAHKNLRYWVSLQPDKYAIQVTKYLNRYWPGWDSME